MPLQGRSATTCGASRPGGPPQQRTPILGRQRLVAQPCRRRLVDQAWSTRLARRGLPTRTGLLSLLVDPLTIGGDFVIRQTRGYFNLLVGLLTTGRPPSPLEGTLSLDKLGATSTCWLGCSPLVGRPPLNGHFSLLVGFLTTGGAPSIDGGTPEGGQAP